MLLNDPEKAPESDKNYFKRLAKDNNNFPNTVACVEFDDREQADIWIERRHEGAQDGIGTKQWDATQKTRHNTSRSIRDSNALAQSLIDYAVLKNFMSKEQAEGSLTTATRYLSNPFFRKTIGVTSPTSQAEVILDVPIDEFEKVLEQFAKDLIDKNSIVSSRSNKSDREQYARKLVSSGHAPTTHGKPSKLADHNNPTKPGINPPTINPGTGRHHQSPDKRKYIIPNDFKPKINNKILKRIFDELRGLDSDQFTLAATFLARAFLENVFDLYHDRIISGTLPGKTHLVMLEIQKHIDLEIKNGLKLSKEVFNAYGFFKKLPSEKHRQLNPENLGAYAHGSYYPNAVELRREWDSIEAFILLLISKI